MRLWILIFIFAFPFVSMGDEADTRWAKQADVGDLLSVAKNPKSGVRRRELAIYELSRLESGPGKPFVGHDFFLSLINDYHARIRIAAIRGLSLREHPNATALITARLSPGIEKDEDVRVAAAIALDRLAPSNLSGLLTNRLKPSYEPSTKVRKSVLNLLGASRIPGRAQAVAEGFKAVSDGNCDLPKPELQLYLALFSQGHGDGSLIPSLDRCLRANYQYADDGFDKEAVAAVTSIMRYTPTQEIPALRRISQYLAERNPYLPEAKVLLTEVDRHRSDFGSISLLESTSPKVDEAVHSASHSQPK